MLTSRIAAWSALAAFVGLAVVLVSLGCVPAAEAAWAVLATILAYGPSGWLAPGGWARRAAEAALLPVAFVFTMLGNPAMRQMMVTPLVVLAAWAATAAALRRCGPAGSQIVLVCFGLSIRFAAGFGGVSVVNAVLMLAAAAVLPFGAARWGGRRSGMLAALIAATLPHAWLPVAPLLGVVVGAALAWMPAAPAVRTWRVENWLPGIAAVALVAAALAPWGGLTPLRAFPAATWMAGAAGLLALALALRLPPGAAGIVWFAVAAVLGPIVAAPPDRGGFTLTAERPEKVLPPAVGEAYVIDVAMSRGGHLATGTTVATLSAAGIDHFLRVGVEAVEWSAERPPGDSKLAHEMPELLVRRPAALRGRGFWRVSGRTELEIPPNVAPVLRRADDLPPEVKVVVPTAGPSTVTQPRDWPFATWLWVTAAAVVIVQLVSGGWRQQSALLPWILLTAGSLVVRLPVEPLRLVSERYGVDLCLAALLAAWLPAARRWLAQGKVFQTVVVLLGALALATPHLSPPLYGDEPFHLVVLDSLATDRDLDITNNVDLDSHPYQKLFSVDGDLFHSPVLAFLLLPGYLVAGRGGALLLLALAGAVTATLVIRRSGTLGLSRSRQAMLAVALTLTYPLATFSTQIWPEVMGALAVAMGLIAAAGSPLGGLTGVALALVATAIKTRLALLTFPIAVAAWIRHGNRRIGMVAISLTALSSLAVGWIFMGHPFGYYRRLHHLLPGDFVQAVTVVGGLLFDGAGGVVFSAPLIVVAVLGVALLWRRGGVGERALLVGGGLTVVALLSSTEWYGGGSPPARYLVPLLPAAALAGAQVMSEPRAWRRLGFLLLPPALLVWWTLVTRPHFSINPGDGSYWLSGVLARRFLAEATVFFPSFLTPRAATFIAPLVFIVVFAGLWLTARHRPAAVRHLVRHTVMLWLAAATALVLAVNLRHDRIVEVEASQVRHRGGRRVPEAGTFSRYSHTNGWRLLDGEEVSVPLNLPEGAAIELEGWLVGSAQKGAVLEVRWEDGPAHRLPVKGNARHGRVRLPDPPGAGRFQVGITMRCREWGGVVLDRVVVK